MVSFRFASDETWEEVAVKAAGGGAGGLGAGALAAEVSRRRPALRDALNEPVGAADKPWEVVFLDEGGTEYAASSATAVVPAGARVVCALVQEFPIRAADPARACWTGRFSLPQAKVEGAQKSVFAHAKKWKMERKGDGGYVLAGRKPTRTFVGAKEAQNTSLYQVFSFQGSEEVLSIPVSEWYQFRMQTVQRQQFTLEEAEEMMKQKRMTEISVQQKHFGRKLEGSLEDAAEAEDRDERSDSESDSEEDDLEIKPQTKKAAKKEDDDEGGDEKEAEPAKASGRGERRGADSPERGEDWEHDHGHATDDEEEAGAVDRQLNQEEQEDEVAWRQRKHFDKLGEDEDEDEDDADAEDGAALNTGGKMIKKLIRKIGLDSDDSDDDEDDAEDDMGLDEEELDDDLDMLRGELIGPADDEQKVAKGGGGGEGSGGQKRARDSGDASGAPFAKKAKSEAAEEGGITREALRALLLREGKLQAKDIKKHFEAKGVLKTKEDQVELQQLVVKVCKMVELPDARDAKKIRKWFVLKG